MKAINQSNMLDEKYTNHEHEMIWAVSDSGTLFERCDICKLSFLNLNDRWDFRFDTGKWIKNKINKVKKLFK